MDLPTTAPSIMAMASLATPMAIRVAATLSLTERAGTAGATAEHLATETGTAAPALECLLDHLVTVGVFELDRESGRYRPTDLGAQLNADAPAGIKPLLDISCAGRERTVDELAKLAADSGLVLRRSSPVAEGRTALEFEVSPAG